MGREVRAAVLAADRPTNPGFDDVRSPHDKRD
jgi:hypothetical protein